MIELFLALSVAVNLIFVFYSRWLISILKTREEDANVLADRIAEYVKHVKSIHEMEMFYGDQTLQSLIDHGTNLVETVEGFDFLLSEEEIDDDQRDT